MNEFLKLNWRPKDLTKIDPQLFFLSEEAVADSYVYKSFAKPIKANIKKKIKLNVSKEKYVPGKKYYKAIPRRSLLTKSQKSHCLTALKLLQSGKSMELTTASEKCSLQIYKECQPKIVEENRNFLEFVQYIWNKNNYKPMRIRPGIVNYSWYHWERRIKRYFDYPQFYKENSLISLNYDESESTITFEQVSNPLEMGTLAKFSPPSLKEACYLKLVTLPQIIEDVSVNSKLPVSQDENITKLLKTHDIDVVISSSGLKQIIDYTNTKTKWIIPVVIKEVEVNDKKKKIIFIDKVLPKLNPSYHDLKYYACKNLLKSNFCQYKAFSYPTEEAVENICDETCDTNIAKPDEAPTDTKEHKSRSIHHNVSYRIWSIKKVDNQNTLMKNKVKDRQFNMLVRCKLDACECTEHGTLYPVIVKPKIEQQLQYGANIPSKSELAREWASLFFRVYSSLYRARLFGPMSEVVSVEKCSIQKVNSEALSHYNYKPMLGLGVLQKVIEELTNLESGSYLLQHLPKHESFLSILEQCDQKLANFDLHAECGGSKIDPETKQPWLLIDVNYILPVHEEYNHIPCTFRGFDGNDRGILKNKKGAKNKRKTKAKAKGKIQEEIQEPLL